MKPFSHNESYRFTISISDRCYSQKPTSVDYQSMSFHVENLNTTELVERIKSGHSICHVFRDNRRIKRNFQYTNAVFIDVDDSTISMEDLINESEQKPTIAYTTFSDGKNGLCRFRLIYIMDESIKNEQQYKNLYYHFLHENKLEKNKDNCGSVISQLMNGNSSDNIRVYSSHYIYNTDSFLQNVTIDLNNNKNITHQYQYCSSGTHRKKGNDDIDDTENAIRLLRKSTTAFLKQYKNSIIVSHTQLVYNEQGYTFYPDRYYRLDVRFGWSSGRPKIKKYRDGEGRRKRLHVDALMIRAIYPDISFVEMLYNMVYRREHYYDNSDSVLSDALIIREAKTVMAMSSEDIDALINNSKHGVFSTDPLWCIMHDVTRRAHARSVQKMLNYDSIREWYDVSLSVTENLQYAKEHEIKVSKRTLIRFCKDNDINTNPRQRPIEEWYDVTHSVKQNLAWAVEHDIKVSLSQLYHYCRVNHIDTKGKR